MDLNDARLIFRHLVDVSSSSRARGNAVQDWFYFLHIPKTAGTSFRRSLYDQFRATEVYPNAVDYYLSQRAHYLSWVDFYERRDSLFSSDKKLLMGHFRLFPLELQLRALPPRVVFFLRHPVDRVISSINFQRLPGRRYQGLTGQEALSRFGEFEGRLQARSLGYCPDSENLEEVLESLEQFEVFGITERYTESLDLINTAFGWTLQDNYRKNVAKKVSNGQEPIELLRDEVEHYCGVDMALYTRALGIFADRTRSTLGECD